MNAVIRSVVLAAHRRGWEILGSRRGFGGFLDSSEMVSLSPGEVRGITHRGGTILGTTNRGNPFRWPVKNDDGSWTEQDRSSEIVEAFGEHRLDALVVVGGDGSLTIARDLFRLGLPIVGVPKTIDNDVEATEVTFGFDTAVTTATEAIDKLHSTAESHERVLVVEVMGRNAGWIALHSGLAGTADVILIPEIPFSFESVCAKIRARDQSGRPFSIVVVAEGASPREGEQEIAEEAQAGGSHRLGGIGQLVADEISRRTKKETRWIALGHLQRGGNPTTFDRLLALRFGAAAVRAIEHGEFGRTVALRSEEVVTVSLDEAVSRMKGVDLTGDTVATARDMGISLGD